MSGMMAGHLIAAVLGGKMAAANAAHHDWLARWFAEEMWKLAQLYRELGGGLCRAGKDHARLAAVPEGTGGSGPDWVIKSPAWVVGGPPRRQDGNHDRP